MNDLLFSLTYLVLLGLCWYLSNEMGLKDMLSPGVLFPIILFGYSIASSLFVNRVGATVFGYPVDNDILLIFYICVIIGLLGFFAGKHLSLQIPVWHFQVRQSRAGAESDFSNKLIVYAVLFAVLSAPFILPSFNAFSQPSYTERAFEVRLESMADVNAGLKNVFLVSTPVTLIVCASCLLLFDRRRAALLRFAGALAIGLNLGANFLAGWRSSVMATLSTVGIYYHYRVRRFRLSHLVAGSVLVYVLMNGMAFVRATSNPMEMLESLNDEIGSNGLAILGLSKSWELVTGQNLMRQIGGVRDGELKYSFGTTIIDDFLVFIPRPLYPNRPLLSSEKFVETFYPGILASGGGMGLFILQEGHWVAGYFGVFAVMCGFGYVVYSVYWAFLSRRNSLPAVLVYALSFPILCVFSVRSGVIGTLKATLTVLVPLMIVSLLPSVKNHTRQHLSLPE